MTTITVTVLLLTLVCLTRHVNSDSSSKSDSDEDIIRPDPGGGRKIVCYYVNWAQYRPNIGKFSAPDIDPFLCTHIMYAFGKIQGNDVTTFEWNDYDMYRHFSRMKQINPSLKVLLSVGGANAGSAPFESISKSAGNRLEFARNLVRFLRANDFDGIDIDWEFPSSKTTKYFTALAKTIRSVFISESRLFKRTVLLMTCALTGSKTFMRSSYQHRALVKYMDFMTVMTYDLHGGWDSVTGYHSALHGFQHDDPFAQEWVIEAYLTLGIPPEMLVLGIPAYGRSFSLCKPKDHDVRDCSKGYGEAGPQTNAMGVLAYYEICLKIKTGYKAVYDKSQQAAYVYSGDQWVGYDTVRSVSAKVEYAKTKGLGGVMFWDLSFDDFGDVCGDGTFPLVRAAKQAYRDESHSLDSDSSRSEFSLEEDQ